MGRVLPSLTTRGIIRIFVFCAVLRMRVLPFCVGDILRENGGLSRQVSGDVRIEVYRNTQVVRMFPHSREHYAERTFHTILRG